MKTWEAAVDAAIEWQGHHPLLFVLGIITAAMLLVWGVGGFEDQPCWTAPCHLARQTSRGTEYVETRCVVCRPDAGGAR